MLKNNFLIRKIRNLGIHFFLKYGNKIPDKIYLKLLYFFYQGEFLSISHPVKFTEKIQWLKLYGIKDEYSMMADKLAVKEYIKNKLGEEFVIPLLGVWDKAEDIDFEKLPNQFVLKTTHGAGGVRGIFICKDKSKINKEEVIKNFRIWLKQEHYKQSREIHYAKVPKKIFAEEFISNGQDQDLIDYKWYCFNGTPYYCQVIRDRNNIETIDFYDAEWIHQEFVGLNPKCKNGEIPVEKPSNLKKQIEIASILSKDLPFVRVDLYEINGNIYFGELTFFPASGFGKFTPKEWDTKLGELIKLPNSI